MLKPNILPLLQLQEDIWFNYNGIANIIALHYVHDIDTYSLIVIPPSKVGFNKVASVEENLTKYT